MGAMTARQHLFETAVHPFLEGLFAFIRCHAPGDPEDVYQETLLAAWQGFERFRGDAAMKTWLYAIARFKCMDALRRKYRQGSPPPVDMPQEGFEERAVVRADLGTALEQLKEDDRALLYMVYAQGFLQKEAAEVLGIPEGTVKSRLHHLRKQLKERMEEHP